MARHAAVPYDIITTTTTDVPDDAARAAYVAHYASLGLDVTNPESGVPWERLHPVIKSRFIRVAHAVLDAAQ